MSSPTVGRRRSGDSPDEAATLRSSKESPRPVETDPAWRKSMEEIWEFSRRSCSLSRFLLGSQPLDPPSAAGTAPGVRPMTRTTTDQNQNKDGVSAPRLIGRFMGRIGIRARKKGEKKEGREPEWNRLLLLLLLLLLLWLLEVAVVVVLREEGHLPWDWLKRFGEDDASRESKRDAKTRTKKGGEEEAKTVRDGKGGRGSCLVMGSKHDSAAVDVLIYQIVGGLSCTPLASEHIGPRAALISVRFQATRIERKSIPFSTYAIRRRLPEVADPFASGLKETK
ncbi:hypothetical protein GW17_00033562 [Ensete ventricosum]|nr:hypothetical protein GW17_00033562 [Ensete ventricosum]